MAFKERFGKWENWIIALAAVAVLLLCAGGFFDYYYDLNDDVLMKDILAGVYTGTPEGHNIQMLWPISALISLFYRIARGLPWYGLFLCFCHFGCIFLLVKRAVSLCRSTVGKAAVALTVGLFFGTIFLEHLIFAQYTVTCTLLGATAAFLFYTAEGCEKPSLFIRRNIPSILLVTAAYLIRSEMLLLVLPMICVAGVVRWGGEQKIFTKENAIKYFGVIGLILAGLLLGQALHMIAYGSEEWRTFTEFFDNRTELYDFQAPPDYEENRDFYESIGLTESEKILLDNYNFGMDDEIDEKAVGEIAEYAGMLRTERTPFAENFVEKLKAYCYRFLHGAGDVGSDYPWNYIVIWGYAVVFFMALPGKKKEQALGSGDGQSKPAVRSLQNIWNVVWKLALLFLVRTGLWMYILWGERDPVRITHSLYLMELFILTAMAFEQWKQIEKAGTGRILSGVSLAAALLLFGTVLPDSAYRVTAEQQRREEVNASYQELYDYFSEPENQNNFYLIDVYSSVGYSEKMFENVDNSLDNYDIMGGWACKSPLWKKKLAAFRIDSMEQALKDREDVYFVRKTSEDMEWIYAYYEEHGTPVETALEKTVAGEFEIYSVKPQ